MLTAEQRKLRANKAGSSDAAAILGLSEYATPYDVYLVKTGRAADFAGNKTTERGNYLERAVVDWAEQQIGKTLARNVYRERGDLCVNFDAIVFPDDPESLPTRSVEAKTSIMLEKFGDAGSDIIPDEYLVQVHHHRVVVPTIELCFVPVLLAGYRMLEFRMFEVALDKEVSDEIGERVQKFMDDHVKKDIPPSESMPSLDVLKRVKRKANRTIEIESDLVRLWRDARDARLRSEKDEEETERNVIAALGDAEAATCSLGSLTYLETTRRERAREARVSTYRSLRLKEAK